MEFKQRHCFRLHHTGILASQNRLLGSTDYLNVVSMHWECHRLPFGHYLGWKKLEWAYCAEFRELVHTSKKHKTAQLFFQSKSCLLQQQDL
uniref:AlNc14C33G3003 protein n=1 Tax=Albugo laibachii Nc14 TaxID=890382 RepID=F0W8A9_9STRA|nr:AlNc14C33G3003 [Albugo laibachii Nc14]|eukprot:CCA17309.1 AlNc14C33G3003 [Albugo laibachii Nc14]